MADEKQELNNRLADMAWEFGGSQILTDEALKEFAEYVTEFLAKQPWKTVYVVTWTPDAVGGFDWFWNKGPARKRAEELQLENPNDNGIRVEDVKIPGAFTPDPSERSEITEWLDTNWYDR